MRVASGRPMWFYYASATGLGFRGGGRRARLKTSLMVSISSQGVKREFTSQQLQVSRRHPRATRPSKRRTLSAVINKGLPRSHGAKTAVAVRGLDRLHPLRARERTADAPPMHRRRPLSHFVVGPLQPRQHGLHVFHVDRRPTPDPEPGRRITVGTCVATRC